MSLAGAVIVFFIWTGDYFDYGCVFLSGTFFLIGLVGLYEARRLYLDKKAKDPED
jgi:hypothetical protein